MHGTAFVKTKAKTLAEPLVPKGSGPAVLSRAPEGLGLPWPTQGALATWVPGAWHLPSGPARGAAYTHWVSQLQAQSWPWWGEPETSPERSESFDPNDMP